VHPLLLAGTTFLASTVEAVEAITIVLAVGYTHSWRAALAGTAWALLTLAVICGIGGPALVHFVPLTTLQLVIGLFLVLFGMTWLRKAIWRYSGRKALHDEDAIYEREVAALRARHEARVGFARQRAQHGAVDVRRNPRGARARRRDAALDDLGHRLIVAFSNE